MKSIIVEWYRRKEEEWIRNGELLVPGKNVSGTAHDRFMKEIAFISFMGIGGLIYLEIAVPHMTTWAVVGVVLFWYLLVYSMFRWLRKGYYGKVYFRRKV